MEKIKRYDHIYGETEEDEDGVFIHYDDHGRIVEEMQQQVSELNRLLHDAQDRIESLEVTINALQGAA